MGSIGAQPSENLGRHFAEENKRITDFMESPKSGSITMSNGQIIEHYTLDEMKRDILKDMKQNGTQYEDMQVAILYNNGTEAVYGEGDDTSKMSLSNIRGVIYGNPETTAYAGKNIMIRNYKQLYPEEYKNHEDDWRIEFERRRR